MDMLNQYRMWITGLAAFLVVLILYFLIPNPAPKISGFVKPSNPGVHLIKPIAHHPQIQFKTQGPLFANPMGVVIVNYHDTSACSLNLSDRSRACIESVQKVQVRLRTKASLLASELIRTKDDAPVKILAGGCYPPSGKLAFSQWRCIYNAYS